MNAARLLVFAVVAAAVAACGGGDAATPTWAGTRDTIGGVEIVRNPAEPPPAPAPVALREVWRVSDTGSGGVWEDPGELAVGHERVYVLDEPAHRVYVVDASTGDDLGAFGREGGGPGEFERPFDIAVIGDRVAVGNNGGPRIDLFAATDDGSPAAPLTYDRSVRIDFLPFGLEALPDGRLWLTGLSRGDGVRRILDLDGGTEAYEPGDSPVADPALTFEGCAAWSPTGSGLIRGCSKRFAFQELTLAGDVLREIFVDRSPVLASQAELDSLEATIRESVGEVGMSPRQTEEFVERTLEEARVKPVYSGFRFDAASGRLYVLDRTPTDEAGRVAALQVFDAERRHVARLPISEHWRRFEASAGRIYALVQDPGTGLTALAAYDVEAPPDGG